MNSRRAFSNIELLVGMAIAAVAVTLLIAGILVLQQNGRDSDRLAFLAEMNDQILSYRREQGSYPDEVLFESTITIGSGNITNLVEYSQPYLKPESATTNSGTQYFYSDEGRDFKLCLKLEDGTIRNTGTVECEDSIDIM